MSIQYGLVLYAGREDGIKGNILDHYRQTLSNLPPEFTTLFISDHLQFGEEPTLEGFTLMSYLAAEFPRYNVSNFVVGQNYRNPALLAKIGATMQYLSGGRYMLGLGAGWHEEEYRAYGYDYPSPGERVEQLAETLEIVLSMWTQSPATYHGKHYHIDNAYCEPRPNPKIPIMIGTNGKKAMKVVARFADAWSWSGSFEEWFLPTYERLKQNCEEVGRDIKEITIWIEFHTNFPDDPAEYKPMSSGGDYVLGPTPEQAIEQLRPFVDFGISHFAVTLNPNALHRFCEEVVSAFR